MNELANQYGVGPAEKLPRRRVAGTVETLRAYIRDGGFAPGDRLPPERQLMGELGVSRGALRKALDALEREGAIWRHVGKGTFVAEGQGAPSSVLAEIARQLTPFQMMRARLAIEPSLAREAAVNASGEALVRMQLAMERAQSASNWQDYEVQDDLFHRSIAEATDNPLLLALFDNLNQVRRAVAWGTVTRQSARPPADHSSFAEHAEIARAISARDPEAAYQAMRGHLRSVSARLFEQA
jgi:DNA-binding FadR family transcriptional regulator